MTRPLSLPREPGTWVPDRWAVFNSLCGQHVHIAAGWHAQTSRSEIFAVSAAVIKPAVNHDKYFEYVDVDGNCWLLLKSFRGLTKNMQLQLDTWQLSQRQPWQRALI